jgi:hypothetical protein
MYKSKLKEWGLSKYVRATEAVAILRAMEERQAAGKSSQIILRGERVDLDRIKNYVRRNRNRGRLERLYIEERPETQEASKELICRTPSPNPIGRMQSQGLLESAEGLYRSMSAYVEISFETGNWYLAPDGRMRSIKGDPAWYTLNMRDLWNRMDMAANLVGKTDRLDLVRLLDPAFGYMAEIVRHQYPRSMSFLLSTFEELYGRGRGDLCDVFIRHLACLSETLLGLDHPHTRLWQSILAVWADEHEELLARFWAALLDRLRQQKVRSNLLEMSIYTDYFDCLLIRSDLETQELSLRREVEKLVESGDDNSEQSQMLYLRHATAVKELHLKRGEYAQAATAMDYLVGKGDWDRSQAILARGDAALAMGDWEAAEGFFREAKDHIHVDDGYKDESWVHNVLTQLETILRHNGKEEEAKEVLQMKLDHIEKLQS